MKATECLIILGTILVMMCGCTASGTRGVGELPDYPVPGGVSAPFAGVLDGYMVVGGGCNFPDVPAARGGAKRFYNRFYALDLNRVDSGWQSLPDMPESLAYGASAVTDEGLVCVGGLGADSAVTRVFRMERQAGPAGEVHFTLNDLPALPSPIDNGAAASVQGVVYVTGGNQPDGGRALYALAPGDTVWSRLPDYPDPVRVQPVLLAVGRKLYLAGGFCYDRPTNTCTIPADMVPYDIVTREWGEPIPFPSRADGGQYALSGGSGVAVDGKLLLTGGVDYKIFKEAMEGNVPPDYLEKPVEWYRFNSDVLVYDPALARWTVCDSVTGMDRAGGALLHFGDRLFMICGEVKPGIRSSQIGAFVLSENEGNIQVEPLN